MQRKPRMGLFVFVAALTIVSSIGLWLATNEIKAPAKPNIDDYARAQPADRERVTPDRIQPEQPEERFPELPPGPFGKMRFPASEDPYPGLPVERLQALQAHRDENRPLRLDHRVTFQRVELGTDGSSMQVRGDVLTDFKAGLEAPEQLAVKVDIALHFYDVLVERDFEGEVQEPWLAPENQGRPVEGQQVEVTIDETWHGQGRARFKLPPVKALAPGIYRLFARVDFGDQVEAVTNGLRWCRDLYGREETFEIHEDPYGNRYSRTIHNPVIDNPERHEYYYRRLLNDIGGVEIEAVIYMASALSRHGVRLVTPHGSSTSQPPTHLVWTEHLGWLKALQNAEEHLADIEKGVPYDAREAEYRREQTRMVAREVNALGGVIDSVQKGESLHLWKTMKARERILEDIADLHDRLRLQYWILLEGFLGHAGWHSVDRAAWRTFNAIRAQDLDVSLQPSPWQPDSTGDVGRRPRPLEDLAARLQETDHEEDPLDPARFVESRDNMLFFDPHGWSNFRVDYLGAAHVAMQERMKRVETGEYAVQVFQGSFDSIRQGFAQVLEFALAVEFFIRHRLHAQGQEQIRADWVDEAQANPDLYAGVDVQTCELELARVLERFDTNCKDIRDRLNLDRFAIRWRLGTED